MKSLLILALSTLFMAPVSEAFAANEALAVSEALAAPGPDDFTIVSDVTENGKRTIEATPSSNVCSKKIVVVVNVEDETIDSVVYTGGCPGNLKAINALTKGMTVDQAIEKLEGITCGNRQTSCTDQLVKVLRKAFGK